SGEQRRKSCATPEDTAGAAPVWIVAIVSTDALQVFRPAIQFMSIATDNVIRPRSSGSVIGVACRYRTLGFSANTAAPATAAAGDSVRWRTIHEIAPTASANEAIEIATADAPDWYHAST